MMAEERSSSYICAEDISVGYHNLPLIQKITLHVNRGPSYVCDDDRSGENRADDL